MTCSEFLTRFSDFYDAEISTDAAEPFRRHLKSCESCRRYHRVVERGGDVLRSIPPTSPRPGFRDRLRHSIFFMEEEERRRRIPSSGVGPVTFALVAVVAAALVMVPTIGAGGSGVELPAIVVAEPSSDGFAPGAPEPAEWLTSRSATSAVSTGGTSGVFPERELWSRSNALLYRYSSLYSRHRESTVVRAGLR